MSTTPATTSYTDDQIQNAIDAAFPQAGASYLANLDTSPDASHWPAEALNRLALARAFLAALPAPSAEPEQPSEIDMLRNIWGRLSIAVDEIDHKGNNTTPDDVLARLAVFKAPKDHMTLPFFVTPKEAESIHALMQAQDMSRNSVLRQALRHYQQDVLRRHGIAKELPPKAQEAEQVVYRNRNADWSVAYEEELLAAKPGHGPQPATFEAHGKTWTRHTPGDPCPVDTVTLIDVLMHDKFVCVDQYVEFASTWNNIIGWRYADEPAQAPAAPTEAQYYMPKLPNPLAHPEEDAEWTKHLEELRSPIPAAWTPKPGDVVRLKSGGPEMTVSLIRFDKNIECRWFDVNGHNGFPFPAACLTPAKEGQP